MRKKGERKTVLEQHVGSPKTKSAYRDCACGRKTLRVEGFVQLREGRNQILFYRTTRRSESPRVGERHSKKGVIASKTDHSNPTSDNKVGFLED